MILEGILLVILVIIIVLIWKVFFQKNDDGLNQKLEDKHRQMIVDINDAMNKLSDRLHNTLSEQEKSQSETFF